MKSKWPSEEIWRKSLALQRTHLRRLQGPEWVGYGEKAAAATRRRIERILAAGLPEWKERDNG